jgi:hypothetical protein
MSITLKCDNGDLIVSTGGTFIFINGLEKCAQDIAESLLNSWDVDLVQYYNGSELYRIAEDPETLTLISAEERIRLAVDDSIDRLIDLQEADDFVDEDEQIDEVRDLLVERVGFMTYAFYLNVVTASEEQVPLDFFIELTQQLPTTFDQDAVLGDLLSQPQNADNAPYA